LQREPIFNVPGVVLALLVSFFSVHALLWLLPEASEEWLTKVLALIPSRFDPRARVQPGGQVAAITSFITHMFVHGNLPHLLINSAWLLAFGSPVAQRTDAVRFLAFFFFTGIVGALFYIVFNGRTEIYVVGASGAISGLMGAAFRFLFSGLDRAAERGPIDAMRDAPLMPLATALRDRRLLLAVAAWTVINLVLAKGATVLVDGAGIAWEAHLGGFYAGLLSFGWFVRSPPVDHPAGDDAAGAS
jgi:membrane associated rhomboid family serine protease